MDTMLSPHRIWSVAAVAVAGAGLLAWSAIGAEDAAWATTLSVGAGLAIAIKWVASGIARRASTPAESVLILGASPMAARLIEEIEGRPDDTYRLIGAVDDSDVGRRARGVTPIVGRLDQFAQIVAATRPTRIVIAMADRRGRVPEEPLLESRFRGVIVEDAVDFFERTTGKLAIESLRPSSLILCDGFRYAGFRQSRVIEALRRCGTVTLAIAGLILTAPLLALVALGIKLDSPGPVFFVQDRVGQGGRPFGLVKFRTMRAGPAGRPSEWVSDNADRITRVGAWLRRFRIDELPQLINVARGEMDLIGPRPHPVSNYQLFLEKIPYYGYRAMVRPGITGWAQVRYGYANDLEEETEKMRYDLYYIKHQCLSLDVRIVLETIGVLLFNRRSHQAANRRLPVRTWSISAPFLEGDV